jgi:CGNR zinc finger protein
MTANIAPSSDVDATSRLSGRPRHGRRASAPAPSSEPTASTESSAVPAAALPASRSPTSGLATTKPANPADDSIVATVAASSGRRSAIARRPRARSARSGRRDDHARHLRRPAAHDCTQPFVDLGRGAARRFCSEPCATRTRVAALRRRRR